MPSRGFCLASSRALCLSWSHEWTFSAREDAAWGDSHSRGLPLLLSEQGSGPVPSNGWLVNHHGGLWLSHRPTVGVGGCWPRSSLQPLGGQGSLAFTPVQAAGGCRAAPYLKGSLPWGWNFLAVCRVFLLVHGLQALGEVEMQEPDP